MPCIFLSAGITKRLQVTTADTGLPGEEHRKECGGNVQQLIHQYCSGSRH